MAKDYASRNPQQLVKVSGKDTFVEIMNDAFGIGKVVINFAKYNDKAQAGSKITDQVNIYMDMDEALVLCHDVISGKIAGLAKIEKDKGKKYPDAIFTKLGGTSAKSLASKGKSRPDGMSESRQFKIQPGARADFMLVGEKGKGEENATGLIVPKSSETKVMVPFSSEDLKKLALVLQSNIQAYTVARYVDGSAMTNPYQRDKQAKAN